MRSPGSVAARRVAAPSVFVLVTIVVMAVHTLARDHRWRYEWVWATYQYHFGVLLLGPVLCGVGAWAGRRARTSRWLTRPAGRVGVSVSPLGVAIVATWLAYVVAWSIPAVIVASSGTGDRPGAVVAFTFLPALVALAAYVACGFAAGTAWPSRLVPPTAAIASFGLTMLGWITGAERLVRLGGAGSTMVELRPVTVVQVGQLVVYGSLALLAAWWSAHHLGGGRSGVGVQRCLAGVTVAAAALLLVTSSPMFGHPRSPEACAESDGLSLCAASSYASPLRALAPRLAPALRRARDAGVPLGDHVRIGTMVDIFEPSPSTDVLAGEVFNLLGVGRCWAVETRDDVANLSAWAASLVGGRTGAMDDPSTPSDLRSDDPAVQDQWAAEAIRRVRQACPSGN